MKILHTADWHVGKTLRGRSRAEEHRAVLEEMAETAEGEQVDLVLVAGDLFDSAAPSPEAEGIVYRALLDLAETGAQVVVVAGNHDNPRRLQAVAPLLDLGRVVVASFLKRADEGGVVKVDTRSGETAQLALLPFLSQRYVVKADDLMGLDPDQHAQKYAGRVRLILGELTGGFGADTVNLVVSHTTVAGGRSGGGERSAHTIFDYQVPASAFSGPIHYVALGHLHRPQRIPGSSPIWYSGSPLQLDFGEVEDHKSVLLVEASPGKPAEVRRVRLRAGRRLRTISGSLQQLQDLAGTTGDDYLKVVVHQQARPGLGEQVRDMFPEAVDVMVVASERGQVPKGPRRSGLDRPPRELFCEYLAERDAFDERLVALFDELLGEAP